jgi:hypothetical protein
MGIFVQVFKHGDNAFHIVMLLVFVVFYIVAIVISFYAYREFKGMMFDHGMVSTGGLNNLLGG